MKTSYHNVRPADRHSTMPHATLDESSLEWKHAWDELAKTDGLPGYPAAGPCPFCHAGECWEYMGTWMSESFAPAARVWVHEFRHRSHPKTTGRVYRQIKARELPEGYPELATVPMHPKGWDAV